MRSAMLFLLAVPFTVQGCTVIKSREPLYDRTKESTFNEGLVGTWSNEDMRWTIVKGDPNGAVITLESINAEGEDDTVSSPADLVRIGSWRYVFFRGDDGDAERNLTAHTLPAWRMKRDWSELRVSYVNADALAQAMKSGQAPFAHAVEPSVVRVTQDGRRSSAPQTVTIDAPAEDIRAFLKKHEGDGNLFMTFTLKREE